jgi:hypothetical protein
MSLAPVLDSFRFTEELWSPGVVAVVWVLPVSSTLSILAMIYS